MLGPGLTMFLSPPTQLTHQGTHYSHGLSWQSQSPPELLGSLWKKVLRSPGYQGNVQNDWPPKMYVFTCGKHTEECKCMYTHTYRYTYTHAWPQLYLPFQDTCPPGRAWMLGRAAPSPSPETAALSRTHPSPCLLPSGSDPGASQRLFGPTSHFTPSGIPGEPAGSQTLS